MAALEGFGMLICDVFVMMMINTETDVCQTKLYGAG